MSAPHIILDNLPSLCQKLSDLVEVWRSYNKNNFACFFWHTVYIALMVQFLLQLTSTWLCVVQLCLLVTRVCDICHIYLCFYDKVFPVYRLVCHILYCALTLTLLYVFDYRYMLLLILSSGTLNVAQLNATDYTACVMTRAQVCSPTTVNVLFYCLYIFSTCSFHLDVNYTSWHIHVCLPETANVIFVVCLRFVSRLSRKVM